MGKKSSPPPPDYAALAQQQAAANKDAAQYNSQLNRVNQVDPQGSNLTWSQTPGADGNPVWTQTTSYSPQQQGLYDSSMRIQQNLAGTAEAGLNRVGDAMKTPFSTEGLPGLSGAPGGGTTARVNTPYSSVGAANFNQDFGGLAKLNNQGPNAANYRMSDLDLGALSREFGQSAGSIGASSVATTFDASGVRKLPGQIDDTSRKRVEEALMSRINPQYQADESALRTRLLNSGIEVGTDAYNREMANHSQKLNDARMAAVMQGGQEESRQVGLIAGLQGQEFNQALETGNFAQRGSIANANNSLQASIANANLGSQAKQMQLQALMQGYGMNQANRSQAFNQEMAQAQFGNTANQQDFNNRMQMGGYQNSLAQQDYQNRLGSANFANQAADTATQRQLQIDQVANSMGLANAGFNNQARQQGIQEQAFMRQLPLNELNALRSGAQVTGPQFGSYYTGGNAGAAPIMDAGIAQGNYNAQMAAQQQSGTNAMLGGLANMGGAWLMSDRRLKSDIKRIGTHKLGIGVYSYTLQGQPSRGVMSDELRAVMPDAVRVGPDGFDRVNYSMIGGL